MRVVFGLPVVLFPAINAERFGGDPRMLGLFTTAIGLGAWPAQRSPDGLRTFRGIHLTGLAQLSGLPWERRIWANWAHDQLR